MTLPAPIVDLCPERSDLFLSLQLALEGLYRLDPAPRITDFLVQSRGERPEEMLLIEDEDLYVGVAVDREALPPLGDRHLSGRNLEAFCLTVEAVSHFVCVIFRVRRRRPTSILELELQAEVDKYVACLLLTRRCVDLTSERLRRLLFDGYRLREGLEPAERRRYVRANTLARRYARHLERRFVHRRRLPAMLSELRLFYRMGYRAKQELIQTL